MRQLQIRGEQQSIVPRVRIRLNEQKLSNRGIRARAGEHRQAG